MNVVCAECGAEQELAADAGLEGRCEVCRATLTAASVSRVGVAPAKKRKKKKRPKLAPQSVPEQEFRTRARAGLNWLLLALACSAAAVLAAAYRSWFKLDESELLATGWVGRIAGIAGAALAFLAATAWRPLGRALDHFEPTEWAWRISAALLPVALLTPLLPAAVAAVADLVWLAGWALYLLLVTLLQRLCIRIDRGDLKDSADFVLSMGTGAVVFAALAFLLALVPLAPILAMALMLLVFALLCLPLWAWSYAVLLLRVRSALK